VCSSEKHGALGVYIVTETENYKCVLVQDLWDYCPLPSYTVVGFKCIALRQSLFDAHGSEEDIIGHTSEFV